MSSTETYASAMYLYLSGVLSIACLVSFPFLGLISGKRKVSDSSQPKLLFRRIPSYNQQLAALAKGRTHTFQPKVSFLERKRQKDAKASLIASLPDPGCLVLRVGRWGVWEGGGRPGFCWGGKGWVSCLLDGCCVAVIVSYSYKIYCLLLLGAGR